MLTPERVITVSVTVLATAALVTAARVRPGRWADLAAVALGALIVANEVGWWVWEVARHRFTLANDLPLFPCDLAAFASAGALWFRTPALVEITYFWGIAGTANGVVSPDIGDHFPTYPFFQYFIQHGAIPCAALLLVIGFRLAPRRWAVLWILGLTLALTLVDAFANLLTGGNYMFLRSVPPGGNLLDLFGPWPQYVFGGAALTVLFFALLDLPFRLPDLNRALRRFAATDQPRRARR